ncbi:MAG: adenylate/guanylate cyclase domain-containing protein [Alphaproteobacteria bacterium]
MSEYLDTIASFVPDLIIGRANDDPRTIAEPISEEIRAAVLFADVSGFTKLTERLAAAGPSGAEDLTAILNSYFGEIIDTIADRGGDAVKFAGDALLALFPVGDQHQDLAVAVHRAAAAGLSLQARLHELEVAPGFKLSMKLALGVGTVVSERLGGVFGRWEFLLAGRPLAQLSIGNDHADPGDAIVSPHAWAHINDVAEGAAIRDTGYWRLTGLEGSDPGGVRARQRPQPATASALLGYIPGAIRSRIEAGQGDWLGELRPVSILFVNLPAFAVDLGLGRAHAAMQALQAALYRFEGSINKVSVDDKGASLIAVLGLPPLAHEDDPERAVRAALAMREGLEPLNMPSSIGITTGTVFCGAVGNGTRREYTIMGDAVNLSARLMQAAKGGILTDAATAAATHGITMTALPPIMVKGKADPIAIHRPEPAKLVPRQSAAAWMRPTTPIVGRDAELRQIADRLDRLVGERCGDPLLIEAEAGMGKSRLLMELLTMAEDRGLDPLFAAGVALEQASPYHAFREVFAQLFPGAVEDDDRERQLEILALLPNQPEILQAAPLLQPVLPAGWSDNSFTRPLAGPARAQRTRELLCRLLAHFAERAPRLLIVKDAHWLDTASWMLLADLAEQVPAVLPVLTLRLLEGEAPEGFGRLLANERIEHLVLRPLGKTALSAIVARQLGVDEAPAAVAEFVLSRADGNPLYCEELALALRDAGAVRVEGGVCQVGELAELGLPDNLKGLVTGRIDRLPAAEQMTLKVASVVGRDFETDVVRSIHPIDGDRTAVPAHCAALDDWNLATPVAETKGRFRFRTTIVREAAYDLMLYSQRRALHQNLATWYEAERPTVARDDPALLAFHWRQAAADREPDTAVLTKAIDYYERAGQQAQASHALNEAIGLYDQALALLDRLPDDDGRARRELRLQLDLGTAWVAAASYAAPQADAAFARARDLGERVGDHAQLFRALRGKWQYHIGLAEYDDAEVLGLELAALAEKAGDRLLRLEAARALGNSAFWPGRLPEASRWMTRASDYAQAGDDDRLARLYGQDPDVANRAIHAWALAVLGEADRAVAEAETALARARALRHPFSLLFAFGGAMWTHQLLRDAPEALRWADRAIELSAERAFPYLGVAGRVVRGWARVMQGDAEAGLAELAATIDGWRATGLQIGLPLFLVVQADAQLHAGQAEAAWETLNDALLLQRLKVERWFAAEAARVRLACAIALRRPADECQTLLRDGMALADELGARLTAERIESLRNATAV